ncbi:glycoside hydrolase family 20 zincin-like fold domain-containing protein [Mycoplasmopsis cynos]|uniref:hypothetical protein n=1 Tax=Mycoplasmopsis cynos TaxID=171284 RepID=UPI0024C5DB2A|nr:hypothetical protein [Mycoplasmopsis cynos]WAM11187.1 glycoside hydrolase family 20 zincin-like fold domain-containing protein [Mycoplasmopsis cynos]
MLISNSVKITAIDSIGVHWSTRTLLQTLMLSKDFSIPKGEMKDYPKSKIRGFHFDVGRKVLFQCNC